MARKKKGPRPTRTTVDMSKGWTGKEWPGALTKSFCKPHCGEPFIKLDERRIGGASDRAAHVSLSADLIVDCAAVRFAYGPFRDHGLVGPAERLIPHIKHIKMPAKLSIPWPDMGVPPVADSFWREMWEALTKPGQHIVFCCVGGHGRTGTAVASLLITIGGMSAQAAIDLVREKHCYSAIETEEQEWYLHNLAQ